jgi:transposase
MESFLSSKEKQALLDAHKACREKRYADRIKTILHLNDGADYETISLWLLLDDSALRDYFNRYQTGGLDALLSDNYKGSLSYLSSEELKTLEAHLSEKMYLHSKQIQQYISDHYKVNYTVEGTRVLLKRLGFVYKKTKHLPGKGDLEKQYAFEKAYYKLKSSLGKQDGIYFMDGVHPLHNSINCNGWIKKGTEKAIRANTGRDRLNINGACNVEKIEVIINEGVTVNAQSTIALFDKMLLHQPKGKLNIIADNARYYRCSVVSEYLKNEPRINLIFLPPYSPNLNLIERLWRFYKQTVLYDTYHKSYEDFKKETLFFFENIGIYKNELRSRLKDNFYFPLAKFS